MVIRLKIKVLMAKRGYELGRRLIIGWVAEVTGIHRMTLSKMINRRGYSTMTELLGRLCAYFSCSLVELVEYVKQGNILR